MLAELAKGARTQMSDPTHTPDDQSKVDQPTDAPADSAATADTTAADTTPADTTAAEGSPSTTAEPEPAAASDAASAEPAPAELASAEPSAAGDAATADPASAEPTTPAASAPEQPEQSEQSETPAASATPATPAASTYTGPTSAAANSFPAPQGSPQPGDRPTEQYPTAPIAGSHPAPSGPPISTAPGAAGTAGSPAGATATKEKRRSIAVPVVIALVAGAVVGGGSAAGVSALINHGGSSTQSTSSGNPQTITINDSGDVNAVTAIAKKAGPSVVTINVTSGQEGGTGSGVILSDDGGTAYVLTNTHVVTLDGQSGSGSVEVTTFDGKLYKATVVGTDPIVDLAVIKFSASGLTPIEFGDSSKLNVGDRVVAIGAPLGLSNTVTDGIVSALNRSIQIQSSAAPKSDGGDQSSPNDNGGNGPFNFWNFGNGDGSGGNGNGGGNGGSVQSQSSQISLPVIQTDAAINPGNSGGALVDDSGKLVGINVAIASTGSTDSSGQSGSIGVGFAVPADLAHRIATEIQKTGKGTHGLLGASVQDATADNSSTVGALIASVTNGGAAADAGLQKGDVVTGIAAAGSTAVPVTSSTDLTAQVRFFAPGTKVTVTYVRDGKPATADVTLGTLSS